MNLLFFVVQLLAVDPARGVNLVEPQVAQPFVRTLTPEAIK